MASVRPATTGEAAMTGFSYAQAAKGKSNNTITSSSVKSSAPSSATSGNTTPTTNSIADVASNENATDDSSTSRMAVSAKTHKISRSTSATTSLDKQISREETKDNTTGVNRHDTSTTSDATRHVENVHHQVTGKNDSMIKDVDTASQPKDSVQGDDQSESVSTGSIEKVASKSILYEAKPPSVNIWAQRAAELKARMPVTTIPVINTPTIASVPPTPSGSLDSERNKTEPRRRSEQGYTSKEFRKPDTSNRIRDDARAQKVRKDENNKSQDNASSLARRPSTKQPRDRASSDGLPPPVVASESAWPKPTTIQDDEKRQQVQQSQTQQQQQPNQSLNNTSNDKTIPKLHGKTEWKVMPYTPSAVFETRIDSKTGPRPGKNIARGAGAPQSTRPATSSGTNDTQRAGAKGSQSTNGEADHSTKESKADIPMTDLTNRNTNDADSKDVANSSTDADKHSQEESKPTMKENRETAHSATDMSGPKPFEEGAKRNHSIQETSNFSKRKSGIPAGFEVSNIPDFMPQMSRSNYNDRRESYATGDARDGNYYRDNKRGGGSRRGGARGGGYTNGNPNITLNTNTYISGLPENAGSAQPFSPSPNFYSAGGRGGSASGKGGYKGHLPRSQSIPLDVGAGRGMPGYGAYPMMTPMQPFMPDMYSPFPTTPYPMPASERDFLVGPVLQQVEYYFSIDNLLKDIYLRKHMDSQGWIFLHVIAQFNRLKQLTTDYEVLKTACLQSEQVEIRVGEDGKDRLRKVRDWEQWVLPVEDRDASAKVESPTDLRKPSPTRAQSNDVQISSMRQGLDGNFLPNGHRAEHAFNFKDATSAPFYPGMMDPQYANFVPNLEEGSRGRQDKMVNSQAHVNGVMPDTSIYDTPISTSSEVDRFPSSQIDTLTVVVRKHNVPVNKRPSMSNASARTFSNGSIDSSNIMEEVMRSQYQTNGVSSTDRNGPSSPASKQHSPASSTDLRNNSLTLFWVKDEEAPVDVASLPADITHETYTVLRSKALAQREAAATGTCPYDLNVLYQFWSHFLIRNFNSHMYHEFKTLATGDALQRHNTSGMKDLIKYYSEALSSQIIIREEIARDYAELVKEELNKTDRPALKQLRDAWRNGALNLKNRKKIGDFLHESVKKELDS